MIFSVKVRITGDWLAPKGTIIPCSKLQAESLIAKGVAEYLDAPKEKAEPKPKAVKRPAAKAKAKKTVKKEDKKK